VKPHLFHPEADQEYAAEAVKYGEISRELGDRFYDEIEGLIAQIRERPQTFRAFDPPARRHLSMDFPFAVIYLDQPELVWIVAVMHLHREPGYWKRRIE
jgi:toxin ParE1/3/4